MVQGVETIATARAKVLCLGKFDALHLGHRALVAQAAALGSPALLHLLGMAQVLGWEPRPPLVAPADRVRIFGQWEMALHTPLTVVPIPFAQVRPLSAEAFCQFLHHELGVVGVVVGEDFRFGFDRQGDTADLQRFLGEHGVQVVVVPAVISDGERVSSSRIRALLEAGEVVQASALLGRHHRVLGRVMRGDGRGRGLGIPTANLGDLSNHPPGSGVYACRAYLSDGGVYPAAVNVGHLPTIGADRPRSVEAHLLDFTGDLYGQNMAVEFITRIRGEQRFAGLEELVQQIGRDIKAVRHTLVGDPEMPGSSEGVHGE